MATPRTAFRGLLDGTKNIDISSSSQEVSLAVRGKQQIRIRNAGTADAFFTFGPGTATASLTTSMSIGAGCIEVLTVEDLGGTLYAAAIAAGSTGKIYFTPGTGL